MGGPEHNPCCGTSEIAGGKQRGMFKCVCSGVIDGVFK